MKPLLHTICLEPARWTPERVSQRLVDLLAPIARSGFTELEIFEPHLRDPGEHAAIQHAMRETGLAPVVLSSYLDLEHPALDHTAALVKTFGFSKVRLFPSRAAETLRRRLEEVTAALHPAEILLETHDGSIADDPALLVSILEELALPNVGLLYQPTQFTADAALAQMRLQKHLVRHLHLQNRRPDLTFATLSDGVVPWPALLCELGRLVPMSIEFVPKGICAIEDFDLEATLLQARQEADYITAHAGIHDRD